MAKIVIHNPFTNKSSKIDPYGRLAKKIYKWNIDAGAEPDTILPADLNYANGRFRRIKTVVDTNNVRRITYASLKNQTSNDKIMSYFRKVFKNYKGKSIRVAVKYVYEWDLGDDDELTDLKQNEKSEIIDIPDKGFSSWWKKWSIWLWIDSIIIIFDADLNDKLQPSFQAQLVILTLDKVAGADYQQYFLDGITNCIFTPMLEWATMAHEAAKSKSAIGRYNKIKKDIVKYEEIYSEGIPVEDFGEVCNKLQVGIEIDLPTTLYNKTEFINIRSQKKPLKVFKYINTRIDHVEVNANAKFNYIDVSSSELDKIFDDARNNKEFILWKECKAGLVQVNTLSAVYKLKDDEGYMAIATRFEEANNIGAYKIEHNANKQLSKFLLNSVNPNQSVLMNWEAAEKAWDNDEDVQHIDMKKAYTQGMNCSFYKGYLGKITDFRKCTWIMGLGIYMIKNIQIHNPLIKKMNILWEGHAYPSPELEYYANNGVSFDIVMGCWGSAVDIDFDLERAEKNADPNNEFDELAVSYDDPDHETDYTKGMFAKEDGTKHYCKWYGCAMKLNTKDRYSFSCEDLDYAQVNALKAGGEADVRYNEEHGEGIIEYRKKKAYHKSHIASFICSYSRLNMLEQLQKFKDIDDILAVNVDGIYYKDKVEVEIGPLFRYKNAQDLAEINDLDYVDEKVVYPEFINLPECRENNRLEVHTGAGGCGKTHRNLTDKGFVEPMFIAPSWKLARSKAKDYGCEAFPVFYLTAEDPDKWRPIYNKKSTLIIDEISMLSNEDKQLIIKRFDNHKIVFCGDLGYQLPPIHGSMFKVGTLAMIEHTTNYRCKCKKLKKILDYLRGSLHSGKIMFNSKEDDYFGIPVLSPSDIDYTVQDLIITPTHKTKDIFTETYTDLDKFVILENTRDYCNGEIIIGEKPKKVRSERRHAFTIHSIQGETAKTKLFIDLNGMRDIRMFYTALSRAETIDQIILVRSP